MLCAAVLGADYHARQKDSMNTPLQITGTHSPPSSPVLILKVFIMYITVMSLGWSFNQVGMKVLQQFLCVCLVHDILIALLIMSYSIIIIYSLIARK